MSKVVEDVISDNFCLKKFSPKGGGCQKIKILDLGANSTIFCIPNQWASREVEMHKLLGVRVGGGPGGYPLANKRAAESGPRS